MHDIRQIFTTALGIGQRITKITNVDQDPSGAPELSAMGLTTDQVDCCYYMHCPTEEYKVVPTFINDGINAENIRSRCLRISTPSRPD